MKSIPDVAFWCSQLQHFGWQGCNPLQQLALWFSAPTRCHCRTSVQFRAAAAPWILTARNDICGFVYKTTATVCTLKEKKSNKKLDLKNKLLNKLCQAASWIQGEQNVHYLKETCLTALGQALQYYYSIGIEKSFYLELVNECLANTMHNKSSHKFFIEILASVWVTRGRGKIRFLLYEAVSHFKINLIRNQ